MKQILTKSVFVSCFAFAASHADAQVYPYFVDFERDSIKAYASADPVTLNGIRWVMPGVYLGDMEPSDRKNGLHAARVRLTGNTTGDNGTITMEDDLSQGIDTVSFYHAMYGSETDGKLVVYYSTNQGANWTKVGDTITPGTTLTRAAIPVRTSSPARISIRKTDGTPARINVDDIMITGYNDYATNVIVTDKTPVGRNVLLSTNKLTIRFNGPVAKGTGNIVLHNVTAATNQTIDVTSADVKVTAQNPEVEVEGISLASGNSYYVTFDSAAFTSESVTARKSTGIYEDYIWTFTAIDTATPPGLLNETFTNCAAPDFMGQFRSYSVSGAQNWRCGTQGHTDDFSVYMNGGFSGGANDNEDWLITSSKLDLSTVGNPVLDFWTKVRFSGATTKEILISTDYTGTGSPASATWQTVKNITDDVSGTDWVPFSNIPLASYKATPFYLAFKYVSLSANNAAQEWSLDDIVIRHVFPENVSSYHGNGVDMKVLGYATTSGITLSVTLPEAADMKTTVYDLAGRKVYEENSRLQAGQNIHMLNGLNLHPGMYLVRTGNGKYSGIVKALVQ